MNAWVFADGCATSIDSTSADEKPCERHSMARYAWDVKRVWAPINVKTTRESWSPLGETEAAKKRRLFRESQSWRDVLAY